jgi:hypothetical protein
MVRGVAVDVHGGGGVLTRPVVARDRQPTAEADMVQAAKLRRRRSGMHAQGKLDGLK